MIQFSPRLKALLSQNLLSTFVCIQVETLRLTTFYRDLVLEDGLYMSTNIIDKTDRLQLNSIMDRDLYKIYFVDSAMTLASKFDSGLNGAAIQVLAGCVDQTTNLPVTDRADMMLIYKGIVESYSYTVNTDVRGSAQAVITCSNLMASLDDAQPFYTSKDYINNINPGDTCFDQIYNGSGKIMLKWGKSS